MRRLCEECQRGTQHLSQAREVFIYGVQHWLCEPHERIIMSEPHDYLWRRYGSYMTARELGNEKREGG